MQAYGKNAITEFQQSLSLSKTLLDLEQTYNDPPGSSELFAVMGLRGGASVLMVAAFESFLSQLFEEKLDLIVASSDAVDFNKLPEKIQENTIFGTLERAMKSLPHEESTTRFERLELIDTAAKRVIAKEVNPGAFSITAGNPNSKRVKTMFKNIGISDIFADCRGDFNTAWKRNEIGNFQANKLDEIVQRRHVVAHSADTLAITRQDLNDSVRFLETLARVLEVRLETYVLQICSDCQTELI